MDSADHELIFKALCSSIREHQRIIKEKEQLIQDWQTSFHEEALARVNFRDKYFEQVEVTNTEKAKFKILEETIDNLKKEVDFWRDKHISRTPERRQDVSIDNAQE